MPEKTFFTIWQSPIEVSNPSSLIARIRTLIRSDEPEIRTVMLCTFDNPYEPMTFGLPANGEIRQRYRLRQERESLVFEKALRFLDQAVLESFPLSPSEAEALIQGQASILLERPEPLAREFLVQAKVQGLVACLSVTYTRITLKTLDGKLRIYLDSRPLKRFDPYAFLETGAFGTPAPDPVVKVTLEGEGPLPKALVSALEDLIRKPAEAAKSRLNLCPGH